MGRRFDHRLRVRYGECDPQGVVFNANYLLYFDVVFAELWRAAIGPWGDTVAGGLDAVLAETTVRFRAPARFDDELEIVTWVTAIGTTSLQTAAQVRRGDELLAEGEFRYVFIDTASGGKTAIPDWARAGLEPFVTAVDQPVV